VSADDLGRKAALSRAAYVAAAEKVARGDRDAVATAVLGAMAAGAAADEVEARRAVQRETRTEWRPDFAKHVVGSWNRRTFDDDGLPEEQTIEMRCDHCGTTAQRKCASGLPMSHVQRFTVVHLHRDALYERERKPE